MSKNLEVLNEWLSILAIIFLLVVAFSIASQRDQLKSEAVKCGAAEWVVDHKTGNATFHWKHK